MPTRAPVAATVPLHFGDADQPLFGCYYPVREAARRCGVVVCSPIGYDDPLAYRRLCLLAERLQSAGYAVLRFDFHGTGDSAADERDPALVSTWVADIGRAVDELKRASGVDRICLTGVRLAATLATVAAAEREDVEGLILWAPYLDGAAYLDASTRRQRAQRAREPHAFACEPDDWNPGGTEALGLLLTPETVAELEAVDLRRVAPSAQRALLVSAGDVTAERRLLDQLDAAGAQAQYSTATGDAMIDETVQWLAQHFAAHLAEPRPR